MNYDYFVKSYIEIEKSSSDKAAKARLIKDLIETLKNSSVLYTYPEVVGICQTLFTENIRISIDLFSILYPIIKQEINTPNIYAIKLLLRFNTTLIHYLDKSYLPLELIQQGLCINANDVDLLTAFEEIAHTYIQYTIHEVPSGILYEHGNGASSTECDDLLKYLKEYEEVCTKLNIDNTCFIDKAKKYYSAYKTYLDHKDVHESFAHYLKEQKIL